MLACLYLCSFYVATLCQIRLPANINLGTALKVIPKSYTYSYGAQVYKYNMKRSLVEFCKFNTDMLYKCKYSTNFDLNFFNHT